MFENNFDRASLLWVKMQENMRKNVCCQHQPDLNKCGILPKKHAVKYIDLSACLVIIECYVCLIVIIMMSINLIYTCIYLYICCHFIYSSHYTGVEDLNIIELHMS